MNDARPLPLWAGRTVALLGIVLVGLNLRTAVAAFSPIVHQISDEIPLSALSIGIIGAAPPIAFAVSGFLGPWITRRLGLEGSLFAAMAAMILGHLARALAPTGVLLIVATIVCLLGVGVGNVLLPPVVKRYFPDRIGLVTTLYVTFMSIGSALPPLLAVPVAEALGWRSSLGLWFLTATLALAPWVRLTMRRRRELARRAAENDGAVIETEPALEARLWHSPVAWAITALFAVSSITAYASFAWLPSLLIDTAKVPAASAGALLSLFAIMGFPASLFVPVLASRLKNVGWIIYGAVAFGLAGYAGLLFAPASLTVLWVALVGLAPVTFPLTLVLINSRTRTHAGSVALSGFVQGIGYVLGALGPLVIGLSNELSGGWTVPIVILVVVSLANIPAAFVLTRKRFVEDELAGR